MTLFLTTLGIGIIVAVFMDVIVTAAFPNRVKGGFWFASFFHRSLWAAWSNVARHISLGRWQEKYLSLYGPFSMMLLLCIWACGLVIGFALLHWMADSFNGSLEESTFLSSLNKSISIFLPFGQGDTISRTTISRLLTVAQAILDFCFLAIVAAYLITLYREFSRRQLRIALFAARFGLPPKAAQLPLRHNYNESAEELMEALRDWVQWSAELLVSNRAHPFLGYFRSRKITWLTTLTLIMDASVMLVSSTDHALAYQAKRTFSIARRSIVEMAGFLAIPTQTPHYDRHLYKNMAQLRLHLAAAHVPLYEDIAADEKLIIWQATYEPYVYALSDHLLMALPSWNPQEEAAF
jgi:hypothetical protein